MEFTVANSAVTTPPNFGLTMSISTPERLANMATSDRPGRAAALQLPLDVWLLMIDYLSLEDQLRLSHTSKDLRALMTRRFPEDVRNFSSTAEVALKAFADTSLDHWACYNCLRLHQAGATDLPTHADWVRKMYRTCWNARLLFPYAASHAVVPPNTYVTHLRCIQLALKYTKIKSPNVAQKKYLGDLMAPIHFSGDPTTCTTPSDERIHLHYRAWPKVVSIDRDGSESVLRYVLYQRWEYARLDHPRHEEWAWHHVERGALSSLDVCPHQDKIFRNWRRPSSTFGSRYWRYVPLTSHIESLVEWRRDETVTFSCQYCPTDVSMRLTWTTSNHHVILFDVWKDIDETADAWARQSSDTICCNAEILPMQNYIPGAARHLYENNGRQLSTTTGKTQEVEPPCCDCHKNGNTAWRDKYKIRAPGGSIKGSRLRVWASQRVTRATAWAQDLFASAWKDINEQARPRGLEEGRNIM